MRVSLPLQISVSLGSLVALAGCQAAPMAGSSSSEEPEPTPAEASEMQESPDQKATTDDAVGTDEAADASYADGGYEATGGYQSPNGPETIAVSVTVTDGVISAVEVTPQPTNDTTERYQGMFAGGIADEVVGKSLDEADVSRVAGSSLTSGGFQSALESIRQDAKAS